MTISLVRPRPDRRVFTSSLPSTYAVTEDTPAARLRALLAQVPNTSSASRTQLLHEPSPSLPSDRESDFDPPPRWSSNLSTSSARESLRSLFTHALRSPGDTPRKDVRRNSIDLSEVEDSPRNDRVMQERARNKGKRKSFSDGEDESDLSSQRKTLTAAPHASNMDALRNRILNSHASRLSESISGVSDSSTENDNVTSLRDMHAPGSGISSTSMQLSAQFQGHSNLLDQDSEMQRAMGAADSFDGASSNQGVPPSASLRPVPQMTVSSLAARPRSSLTRAGSLTETKLTANASRRSGGLNTRKDSYDSISSADSATGIESSTPGTPERRDSYHHHRASHSLTGSPLPQEFPRQKQESTHSDSRSSSRAESTSSIADFRDRMKDTEKERQHERERAWNRPLSARPRTISHTSPTSHSPRLGLDQPRSSPNGAARSREHSRPPSPSESVRSRAAEEGDENYTRERNWGSPQPKLDQRRHQASPVPGPSLLRARTDSTHSNGSDTHSHKQVQSGRLRHHPSQSSLNSEDSSRSASPADLSRPTGRKDEEEGAVHERERNWGSRHQIWAHNHEHKRAASPNPAMSHSRVRTQSFESDSSAPAMSILTRSRSPLGLSKGRPGELSLPPRTEHLTSRVTPPPPEAPEDTEHDETSRYPTSASPRLRPVNGHAYDNPVHLPSRLPRPDSPIVRSSGVNGNGSDVKGSPASAPARFGWQFPRNRPQLPNFEPETSSTERSPSPVHRPSSHLVGPGKPSHIPVRSPGQVPKVEIKRNGAVQAFRKGHKRATTEFTEANGAVPPKVHEPNLDPELASGFGSTDTKSPRGSDESVQDAPTPMARTIEIPPIEKVHSLSPVGNSSTHAEGVLNASYADDHDSEVSSPDAAPVDAAPSFELSTPPRPRPSFSTSRIVFETPSPPKGLPELPGPPSSEDDTGNLDLMSMNRQNNGPLNLIAAKTPRPPGAWAATPAPARSQTPQPTSSSLIPAKLSRARSNSLPQTSFIDNQSSIAIPPSALSRAGTLPTRTPAPPGGWVSTPGSLRRKGLMKVRFDNITSDSAASDADAGAKDGKVETSLPVADWDATSLTRSGEDISESAPEPSFNHVKSSSPTPASSTLASGDGQEVDGSAPNTLPDASNYTSAGSPRRKGRRSPSVRLVDEYGRAQEDRAITPPRKDPREHSVSMRMPGGGPLKTPRNVRILDAMGHEVEEASEQNDSEDTVTEVRYSRQEAVQRMKRAVADLQEGLRGVDASNSNVVLDDPRLSELYDLSKAAREMRTQLASSLQQAQATHKYGSLKESMRKSRFLPNFLPEQRLVSWNHWLFWSLLFFQLILFLFMYRMSKIHARHHFLTTYFDPFYGDLYIHPNKPEYNYDTNFFAFLRRRPLEPSYAERLGIDGPMDLIKRSITDAIAQAQRFVWESWGWGGDDDRVKAWPPI
ncbi:hypothetical protein BC827DRAFT_1203507 [Russula dissimulans]|nr:hypothetical protein BC827DRAFT_1203507 [Russula dissimulans]